MKDMKTVLLTVRQSLKAQQSFFDGLKIDELPADIKAGVLQLKNDLNEQLKKLEPLDQVPLAGEAASALNWFVDAIGRMQEYADRMFSNLQTMSTNLAASTKSYNELNARVTGGDLVEKAKVTEHCELAKQAGVDSCQEEIADLRKKVVAGLPVPPENILKLGRAEFASAVTDAQANLAAAREAGLTLDNKGKKFLERTLFLGKDRFTAELAELKELGVTGGATAPNLNGGEPGGDNVPQPSGTRVPRLC